jgi:predicted enzyme related to lactoylglutathione lyase/2-polyprenyl-3-methyl-5-hydroxy-6-metoxy-1,4-benzoquinol methylase
MAVTEVFFVVEVRDMERARRFYQEALGATVAFATPRWSSLLISGVRLGLALNPDRAPGRIGIHFAVDDLATASSAVERAGGHVIEPAMEAAPGVILAHVSDTEGNAFVLQPSRAPAAAGVTRPRGFPSWEALYRNDQIDALPWYWPTLDPDLEAALAKHHIHAGRVLDQGTGPGTQALALAERGFDVTAADISSAAIDYVSQAARRRQLQLTLVVDDVLATKLEGPFDVAFDRGCFHVLAPDRRPDYVRSLHGLLGPSGWLFLKTFSHLQPGTDGPFRFTPDEIRRLFEGHFDVVDIVDTVYQGQLDPWPKALFSAFRRKS